MSLFEGGEQPDDSPVRGGTDEKVDTRAGRRPLSSMGPQRTQVREEDAIKPVVSRQDVTEIRVKGVSCCEAAMRNWKPGMTAFKVATRR